MDRPSTQTPRILFLDDAPDRAAVFLAGHPSAICVQTVEQCIDLLQQPWDEVHLDHDLGREVLVDHERPDCGMAVVRWLCEEPRPHLRDTRFVIHTHNPNAACMMVLHLQVMGYNVQASPFSAAPPPWSLREPRGLGAPADPMAGSNPRALRIDRLIEPAVSIIGSGGREHVRCRRVQLDGEFP